MYFHTWHPHKVRICLKSVVINNQIKLALSIDKRCSLITILVKAMFSEGHIYGTSLSSNVIPNRPCEEYSWQYSLQQSGLYLETLDYFLQLKLSNKKNNMHFFIQRGSIFSLFHFGNKNLPWIKIFILFFLITWLQMGKVVQDIFMKSNLFYTVYLVQHTVLHRSPPCKLQRWAQQKNFLGFIERP